MKLKNHKQLIIPSLLAAVGLLAVPGTRADYSNTVMSFGPVAYWQLNETTQPPAAVSPTANNLGTLGAGFNATFSGDTIFGYPGALAGTTDSADSFNGFTTRAMAPYNTTVSSSGSFTIEAWVLAHDDGTLWGTTCVLSDVDANSPRSGWLIYQNIDNIGQYTFRTYDQNGLSTSLNMDIGAPGSIQVEKWYHLAVVVNNTGTATNVYGFINGQQVAGPVPLPGYVPNDGVSGGFTIGGRTDGDGFDFTGAIDEVAYYTNALDAATILAHYQAGTNPAPATAYQTLVLQSQPALYFRMDEAPAGQPYPVALPVAVNRGSLGASLNGFYQSGTTPGVPGPTNSGFGPVSLACSFPAAPTPNVQAGPGVIAGVFDQPALNFNQALTLAAWIHVPASSFAFVTPIGRGDASYRFDVDGTSFPHFAANPNGDVVGTVALNDDAWHFWVGVFDPVSKTSSLYIDSLLSAEAPGNSLVNLTCYLMIGGAPDYNDRHFVGDIAHVALFTNALTSAQIATLYNSVGTAPSVLLATNHITINAGANGGITAMVAGTSPMAMQWYYQDLTSVIRPVPGQTNATLSLTNVQASMDAFQYYLTLSNAYGAVTSSIVTLTVSQGPPTIQADLTPAAQQVPVGVSLTYSVVVTGSEPFHYQWFQDNSALLGATNSSYTFTVAAGTHTYSVTITNSFGPVNSAVVSVTGFSGVPPVITFNGDGTGWTVNTNGSNPSAGITNGTFLITTGDAGQVATAFFNTPQYSDGFAAFFTYQEAPGSSPLADGTTFCIQNSSSGPAAIGGGGGGFGFFGIGNSAAFEINIYNGANGGIGIQFGTNGMTADTTPATLPYFPPGSVNVASGHPINVQVYCLNGVWHARLADATTGDSYATSVNLGDMRATVGADSAYVGFTGATGGANSIQTVSNFRFSYTTAPVLAAVKSGANLLVNWPVSVSSFFKLQQAASVDGPWSNVAGSPTVVGLQNQMSLPATGTAQFYRLELQ